MADEENLKLAQSTFETLCNTLEKLGWHYKKDAEDLKIECTVRGDDLPMEISVCIDAERRLILLFSRLPFVIQEDKRLDVAIAVSALNWRLVDGSFDYDIKSGRMFFRMTNSYLESMIGEELFVYMTMISCRTIDDYNDKLLMLSKGMLPLDKFLESL